MKIKQNSFLATVEETLLSQSAAMYRNVVVFCLVTLLFAVSVSAQNVQFTQGSVGSGFDVSMSVPLSSYPGRGVSLPVSLSYSSKVWRINHVADVTDNVSQTNITRSVTEALYGEFSTAGWTTSLDVPRIEWPKASDCYWYDGSAYKSCSSSYTFRVSRVFIHMPDGSTHELRESDQPYAASNGVDMYGTFYAVDGSRLRYDSTDEDTGTLFMPDGSRFVLDAGNAQFIDRNGNTLNYNGSNREWTDTLGREIGMPFPVNPQAQDYTYELPGFDNTTLSYTFKWRELEDALTPDAQSQTPNLKYASSHYLPYPSSAPTNYNGNNFPQAVSGSSLFSSSYSDDEPDPPANKYTYVVGHGQGEGDLFNPVVLAEIVLPNGLSYKFSYNIYGEIDKIIYPTGAFETYEYNALAPPPTSEYYSLPYSETNRGVSTRKLSADGSGNDIVEWTNDADISYSPVTTIAPNGTQSVVYRFYTVPPSINGKLIWPFGFEDPRKGSVYDSRTYAPGPNETQGDMLRRNLNKLEWTEVNVPARSGVPSQGNNAVTAYRNPRTIKDVSIILDTGGDALAKTMTYTYDTTYQTTTGLDLTVSTESYFATVGQTTAQTGTIDNISVGSTARSAETTYHSSSSYRDRNILGLATSSVIKNASGQVVAKTETSFDDFSLTTYSDLDNVAHYTDPNTTARGNATKIRSYYDIGSSLYLETKAEFDEAGNVVSSYNARNIQSTVTYSSTYKRAFATSATSAVPDPNGTYGSNTAFTSSSTFDYTTGLVLTTTDINGQVTTFSYLNSQSNPDPLNRLLKVTGPDGSWTSYTYNDELGEFYILTQSSIDGVRTAKSYQYFDAMGRAVRSFVDEGGGSSYLVGDIQYDELGRTWRTSNPYRVTSLTASVNPSGIWTSNVYDALSRVIEVTFNDGTSTQTVAETEYQGIYTTVTDQAGKKRRSKVDALGRIVRVDEPNSSGSLGTVDSPNQATSYDYDTVGNIIKVTQGSSPNIQYRYFKYDALSRLLYERHVEQAAPHSASDSLTGNSSWSHKLVYDETINNVSYKGLLTSGYDARNIQTQMTYDQLNRSVQVTYSDGTPTVTNKYDQTHTGYFNKGNLTEITTASTGSVPSTSQAYDFDLMGRVVKQTQTVDTNSYTMGYTYNLGGMLVQQTYPSGRIVNYGIDGSGRLTTVNSGQNRVYATGAQYGSNGVLSSMILGNGAVLSYGFNARLQLSSINMTRNGDTIQKYEYKYGEVNPSTGAVDESKNNGQLARIESWIGTNKQWQQRFVYDSIGRLSSATEVRGDNSQQSYLINYDYDLFGNRYQKEASNSNNPFSQVWVETTDISQTTNRFTFSGVGYDNAGNITSDSKFRQMQFQYDANGRQKYSANLDNSGGMTAVFDGTGQRVAIKEGSDLNVMVYDISGKLIAEYTQNAPTTGATQYIMADHQGSTRVVADAAGNIVSRNDYLPFGEDLYASVGMRTTNQGFNSSDGVRQKYAGMEKDEATGMAHTLWRKYDDMSGRWTGPDPYGGSMTVADPQSFNRYTYVNNDPVNKVDPTGLMLSDMGVFQTSDPRQAALQNAKDDKEVRDRVAPIGVGLAAPAAATLTTSASISQQNPQTQPQSPPPSTPSDPRLLPIPDDMLTDMVGDDTAIRPDNVRAVMIVKLRHNQIPVEAQRAFATAYWSITYQLMLGNTPISGDPSWVPYEYVIANNYLIDIQTEEKFFIPPTDVSLGLSKLGANVDQNGRFVDTPFGTANPSTPFEVIGTQFIYLRVGPNEYIPLGRNVFTYTSNIGSNPSNLTLQYYKPIR